MGVVEAPPLRQRPVRTCIGCRRRSGVAELVRFTAVAAGDGVVAITPDDGRRRSGGRGAWLHPSEGCLERALQRSTFRRALRIPGTVRAQLADSARELLRDAAGKGTSEHVAATPGQMKAGSTR